MLFDWWRGVGHRARRHSRIRSRVPVPSVVDAHPDLMRPLRDLHSEFDYYVQDVVADGGTVLLLWRDAFAPRIEEGRNQLILGKKFPELKLDTLEARLMEAGYSIVWEGPAAGLWDGRLVLRAREFLRRTLKDAVQLHATQLREADGTMKEVRQHEYMMDAVHADYRSDHKIFFRGKRSFSSRSGPDGPTIRRPVRVIDHRSVTAGDHF